MCIALRLSAKNTIRICYFSAGITNRLIWCKGLVWVKVQLSSECVFRITAKLVTLISPFTAARTQHLTVVLGAWWCVTDVAPMCRMYVCNFAIISKSFDLNFPYSLQEEPNVL